MMTKQRICQPQMTHVLVRFMTQLTIQEIPVQINRLMSSLINDKHRSHLPHALLLPPFTASRRKKPHDTLQSCRTGKISRRFTAN